MRGGRCIFYCDRRSRTPNARHAQAKVKLSVIMMMALIYFVWDKGETPGCEGRREKHRSIKLVRLRRILQNWHERQSRRELGSSASCRDTLLRALCRLRCFQHGFWTFEHMMRASLLVATDRQRSRCAKRTASATLCLTPPSSATGEIRRKSTSRPGQ